jgi:hypothetical protein
MRSSRQYLFGCVFADYSELFARGSAGFGYSDNTSHGFGSNQAGALHYSSGVALATGWQTLVLRQSPPVGATGSAELFKNGLLIGTAQPWKTAPGTGYALGGTSGNAGALSGIGVALLRSGADRRDPHGRHPQLLLLPLRVDRRGALALRNGRRPSLPFSVARRDT